MGRRKEPTKEERLQELARQREEGITELSLDAGDPEILDAALKIVTLKEIRMHNLRELPAAIGNLTALERLNIEQNEFETFPPEIGRLSRLESIYSYSGKLKALPEEIGELKRLRTATLWSNQLTTLPAGVGGLESLEELSLKWNPLRKLAEEIGQLKNLKVLELGACQLADLPASMAGMKSLRTLKLGANKLKEIPDVLFDLPALEVLKLQGNAIKSIPPGIARAKALTELYLQENAITTLPEELFELQRLSVLELGENKIKEVPKGIGRMKGLTTLGLVGNPIKNIPEEIIAEGKDSIFEHLGLTAAEVLDGDKPAPDEIKRIVARYQERLDAFRRAAKKKLHDEKMLEKILAFLVGKSDTVPPARLDDHYGFGQIAGVLAPYPEWTFIDRRVIRFIARKAFYFRQPEHDYFTGYHDELFSWLKPQLEEEQAGAELFGAVAGELLAAGVSEEDLLRGGLHELSEKIIREDGSPTSFGRWLLGVAARDRGAELLVEIAKDRGGKAGLTGLLLRHAPAGFERVASELLEIKPDEDNEIHVPHKALSQVCAVAPERYEALLLEGISRTDCMPCKAEAGRILLECYGDKHRAQALEIARETLRGISDRKNKEDRYNFPWGPDGGWWSDGTAEFIEWGLKSFGAELRDDVFAYAENTKVYDLEVAEVVARTLGQEGLDIVGEGLSMVIQGDELGDHFRRVFALLAPLDWSKYAGKAWEIAQSEHRSVRAAACQALATRPPEEVVPRAKELLAAKKGHVREAGVMILTGVKTKETQALLRGLLDTETNDDARDVIVESFFAKDDKASLAEAQRRIASAAARGKLAKPIAKWLDEKKLPKLSWAGGKKQLAPEEVRFLLHRQTRRTELEPDPEVRAIYALIDRKKSGDFAEKLLSLALKNGGAMAKNRFALSVAGLLGDDRIIAPLEDLAAHKQNENAIRTIGLLGSLEAARALDRIAQLYRTKYPNLRSAAEECFASIAEQHGMTPFELADSMIPDFGLAGRAKPAPVGKTKLLGVIGPDRKLQLLDDNGKALKSAPKGLAEKQKSELKELGRRITEAAKQLKRSLQHYLIVQRRWPLADWQRFFLDHPLAHAFAQGLVWGVYGERLEQMLRVLPGGALVDELGAPVKLAKQARLGLVHPLELDADTRGRWQQAMQEAGVEPPFPQLDRPVFSTSPEEREKKMSFAFEDREVSCGTFKGRAERLGWRRGSVVDAGGVSAYHKVYPQDSVEVFIRTDGLGVQSFDFDSEVTLKELFFVRAGSVATGSYTYDEPRDERDPRLIPLGAVPPIAYSESIADLHAIVASKGAEEG